MFLFFSGGAAASEPTTPIRIVYSVPSGCPSQARLIEHIQERTTRARIAAATEEARELTVRVERAGGLFRGRLVVASRSAHQERDVTDAKCEEVIEALGFFIALSIDAAADASARDSESPSLAEVPAPSPTGAPSAPPPTASSTIVSSAPATEPPPPSSNSLSTANNEGSPEPRAPVSDPSWRFGGGVGAALVSGTAPEAVFASRGHLEVATVRADEGLFAPLFAIGGTSTTTSTIGAPRDVLALRWQALTATFCPVALRIARESSIRPCTGIEVGTLRADGIAIPNARRNDAPWIALGLSTQVDLALWSKVALMGELGASSPFSRSRFSYSSGEIVFETPSIGGRIGLTLVLRP